jgi:hypothetical protein
MSIAPRKVAEHPSFRFECPGCEAIRDQKIRNEEARFIKCVCGTKAEKTGRSPQNKDERINWWVYPDGEYAPGKFADNPNAGAAIAGMMGMGGPPPKPKSLIRRLLRL